MLTIQKLISYRKIILFGLVTAKLFSDPIDSYWQQKVDYDMDIVLHDSIRQITGKSTIKYTNNSPDSLDTIGRLLTISDSSNKFVKIEN